MLVVIKKHPLRSAYCQLVSMNTRKLNKNIAMRKRTKYNVARLLIII